MQHKVQNESFQPLKDLRNTLQKLFTNPSQKKVYYYKKKKINQAKNQKYIIFKFIYTSISSEFYLVTVDARLESYENPPLCQILFISLIISAFILYILLKFFVLNEQNQSYLKQLNDHFLRYKEQQKQLKLEQRFEYKENQAKQLKIVKIFPLFIHKQSISIWDYFDFQMRIRLRFTKSSISLHYKYRMKAKKIYLQNHKVNQQSPSSSNDLPLRESLSGSHSRGRQLALASANHPSLRGPQSRSGSRARRNSKNKLFQKAHQTSEGETYLKDTKNQCSLSAGQNGRSSPRGKTSPEKLSALSVHKEIDLKMSVGGSDQESSFSKLIMQFECEDLFLDVDLSSINQDRYQTASQVQFNQSLLRGISAK